MSRFRLRDHIHFCEIGDERVFLDLKADRYFSLPPASNRLFSSLLDDDRAECGAEARAFLAAGLLVETPDGRPLEATRYPAPGASLVEEGSGSALSLSNLPEVSLLVLLARRAVKRKQLPRLLAPGPASVDLPPSADLDRRDAAVRDFMQARRFVPVAPNCLYDSLALRRFLQRRAIIVDLVIGAKLHPFGAHCWLQDGATVLNDALATARGFAPILVA